jgi:hypothetical protein
MLASGKVVTIMALRESMLGIATLLGALACSPIVNVADDSTITNAAGMAGGPLVGGASGILTGQGGTTTAAGVGTGGGTIVTLSSPTLFLSPDDVAAIEASACNAWAIEPESSPTKLQLVVDVSSSMSAAAPGTSRSKWEVTRDALLEAIPGVDGPGLPANTAVGLMFFPNKKDDSNVSTTPVETSVCLDTQGAVPVSALGDDGSTTQRTLLRQRLTEAVLGRGTPTVDAYNWALHYSLLGSHQPGIDGDPYLLLITDGMPTLYEGCWNPSGTLSNLSGDSVVQAVEVAYTLGVRTFVVGSPGSEEARSWLSKAAFVGGTGADGCSPDSAEGPYCHLDMTLASDFSVALRNGLAQVVASLSTCKFDVPTRSADGTQLVDTNRISPIISFSNGTTILVGRSPSSSADCLDGFRMVSSTQMELCKNTCRAFLDDEQASLRLIFGCSTDDIATEII